MFVPVVVDYADPRISNVAIENIREAKTISGKRLIMFMRHSKTMFCLTKLTVENLDTLHYIQRPGLTNQLQ